MVHLVEDARLVVAGADVQGLDTGAFIEGFQARSVETGWLVAGRVVEGGNRLPDGGAV